MRLGLLAVVLLISGCEPDVTSTFVTGSVLGISLPAASAASAADKNLLGANRQTVWLASGTVCSRLRTAPLGQPDTFGPSFVATGDGGVRSPALILTTDGNAYFDTGNGQERILGTSRVRLEKTLSNGDISARFSASFTTDAGTETVTGDYLATPCAAANPGCSAAPAGLLLVGALLLLRRRRA
ncbi:MAG: hypothetical protein Q8L48_32875 [Archangium sp.]|nr:hypothetical protein [Archangium sp.]